MTRVEMIDGLYESAGERLAISKESFEDALLPFKVRPVWVGGVFAGAVLTRGPEIHLEILPGYRGRFHVGRKLLQEVQRVVDKHSRAVTYLCDGEDESLVRKMGFRPSPAPMDGVRAYEAT